MKHELSEAGNIKHALFVSNGHADNYAVVDRRVALFTAVLL